MISDIAIVVPNCPGTSRTCTVLASYPGYLIIAGEEKLVSIAYACANCPGILGRQYTAVIFRLTDV